jgi:hypothetical protein
LVSTQPVAFLKLSSSASTAATNSSSTPWGHVGSTWTSSTEPHQPWEVAREGGSRTGDSQHRYRANMPRPGDETRGSAASVDRSGTSSSTHPAIPCRSTHGHSTHGSDRRIAG